MNPPSSRSLNDFFACGSDREKLAFLVALASRAPSTLNSQPWLFRIVNGTSLELLTNQQRSLPGVDPDNRQLYISLGCALENLLTAADYYGLDFDLQMFPDQLQLSLVARIVFKDLTGQKNTAADHPAIAIPLRQTTHGPYGSEPLPASAVAHITSLADTDTAIAIVSDETAKKTVAKIVTEAVQAAFGDPSFVKEFARWLRSDPRSARDGVPTSAAGITWLPSFMVPFALQHVSFARRQRDLTRKLLSQTPAYAVISTDGDDAPDRVRAGRLYEQIALWTTVHNLKIAPIAAPIEVDGFYKKLQDALPTHFRPQVFFRIGQATTTARHDGASTGSTASSHRLNIEEIIVS